MDDFLRVFLEIPHQEGLRAAQLLQAPLNFEVDQLLLVLLNQKNSVVSTLRKKILAHRTDNSICIPAGLRVGVKKKSQLYNVLSFDRKISMRRLNILTFQFLRTRANPQIQKWWKLLFDFANYFRFHGPIRTWSESCRFKITSDLVGIWILQFLPDLNKSQCDLVACK